MTSNDVTRFANVERKLASYLAEYGYHNLTDLGAFPFQTLADTNEAYGMKLIDFTVPYDSDHIHSFGISFQRLSTVVLSILLVGTVLANIVFAIYFHQWFFVAGSLLACIGFFISTPFNRSLPLLIAVGLLVFCWALFNDNLVWLVASISFLIGVACSKLIRSICSAAVIKHALYSEPMLCYLLLKRMILMVEPETKVVFEHMPLLP